MNKRIFIDAGHGGGDPGAINSRLGLHEADINLAVSRVVKDMLLEKGYVVGMSRESDDQTTLAGICAASNDFQADLFVSIHCNSFNDPYPTGIETWYYTQDAKAKVMQDELMAAFPGHIDRGIKQATYYVLIHTYAPAILIEMEFISNDTMAEWLNDPATQEEIAGIITQGIEKIV